MMRKFLHACNLPIAAVVILACWPFSCTCGKFSIVNAFSHLFKGLGVVGDMEFLLILLHEIVDHEPHRCGNSFTVDISIRVIYGKVCR